MVSFVRQTKLCCGEYVHMHSLHHSQGYHFKRWKAIQAWYDASNCNFPCRDNNDKYYGIQHGLKKDLDPHLDILATYLWSEDDAKSQSTKTWFDIGIFLFEGRATTYGYLVGKTSCYTFEINK